MCVCALGRVCVRVRVRVYVCGHACVYASVQERARACVCVYARALPSPEFGLLVHYAALTGGLIGLINPADGDKTLFRNIGSCLPVDTA